MIDYKQFQFAACPRTGSTWVMRAAFIAGFGEGSKVDLHIPAPPNYKGTLNVTLVRHPYDWLASYYYFLQGGAVGLTLIDSLCSIAREAFCFEDFVLLYAERHAGTYTKIIESYHGDSVIRTEELTDGIIELFDTLGASDYALQLIRQTPPSNIDSGKAERNDSIPYLQEIVRRAEGDLYEQFAYQLIGDAR